MREIVNLSTHWKSHFESESWNTATNPHYIVGKCIEYASLSASPLAGEHLRERAIECLSLLIPGSPEREYAEFPYEDLQKLFFHCWDMFWREENL